MSTIFDVLIEDLTNASSEISAISPRTYDAVSAAVSATDFGFPGLTSAASDYVTGSSNAAYRLNLRVSGLASTLDESARGYEAVEQAIQDVLDALKVFF